MAGQQHSVNAARRDDIHVILEPAAYRASRRRADQGKVDRFLSDLGASRCASRHAEVEICKRAVALPRIMQTEAPNLFSDYQLVPLGDGTFEARTPHRKV